MTDQTAVTVGTGLDDEARTALPQGVRWSFGLGQMAEGIKNSSFSAFLLFYYNQVLGLPADSAGLAIAISLIFDAVTDPMVGTISDRWRSPLGRRHPFMYASALPLAVSFYFLFAPAAFATSGGDAALFTRCHDLIPRAAPSTWR